MPTNYDWGLRRNKSAFFTVMAALVLAASVAASKVFAVDSIWIGGTGNWASLANWQGGQVPNSGKDAYINNGGTAQIGSLSGTAVTIRLTLGSNAGQSGTLQITGVNLDVLGATVVGDAGAGTLIVQNGGSFTDYFRNRITIAKSIGSVGNVSIIGGSVLQTSDYIDVGVLGAGILTIADASLVHVDGSSLPPGFAPWANINSLSTVNIGTGGLAGTLDVSTIYNYGTFNYNHSNTIAVTTTIVGAGTINKNGTGITTLSGASGFAGTFSSSGGQLVLQGTFSAPLYTASTGGTLRFDTSTVNMTGTQSVRANGGTVRFDATTVNMSGTSAIHSIGGTVEYSGATINGGSLRGQLPGAGTHTIVSNPSNTQFNNVSIQSSASVVQNSATSFNTVTNGGRLTSNAFLFYEVGTNASSGNIIVNNSFNTRDFINYGQITVNSGGSLFHKQGNLASGGGSRITVNSGGLVNLMDGSQLDLNGALLINNGNISGTVNVNYGSLAKGTGTYGVVNVNTGGVYAPGNSPGISTATALTFDSTPVASGAPTLAIELGGTTPGMQYDQLHVTAQLALGGSLQISLLDSFSPASGQTFDILDWGSLSGTFATLQLPALSGSLVWNTTQLYTAGILSVGLPGDYNANGTVDAADYVIWRKGLGTIYTQSDFNVWRANFGQTAGSGASAVENGAVPEPATLMLLLFAASGWYHRRKR